MLNAPFRTRKPLNHQLLAGVVAVAFNGGNDNPVFLIFAQMQGEGACNCRAEVTAISGHLQRGLVQSKGEG